MRRVQRSQNAYRIHYRPDIGAVGPCSSQRRVAQLVHQISVAAAGYLGHSIRDIGIVQHHAFGVLRQARGLLIGWLVEALLVQPDTQDRCCFLSAVLQ